MRLAVTLLGIVALTTLRALSVETIKIPNWIVESPTTTYASPFMDSWQKRQTRFGYGTNSPAHFFVQLTGQFKNMPPAVCRLIRTGQM